MGKVSAGATMSLDGFIAGPEDSGFDLLFQGGAADRGVTLPVSCLVSPRGGARVAACRASRSRTGA
jgi:hypothetical protein